MNTDGGQVKISTKLLGEQNHSKTCLSPDILTIGCCLVAGGAKSIVRKPATKKGILITDANGDATFIEVPEGIAGYNKILATDANANLVWVDR